MTLTFLQCSACSAPVHAVPQCMQCHKFIAVSEESYFNVRVRLLQCNYNSKVAMHAVCTLRPQNSYSKMDQIAYLTCVNLL